MSSNGWKHAFDLSTMVGENFEIQCSQITQNAFDSSTNFQNFVKPISTEISGSTEGLSCMDIARWIPQILIKNKKDYIHDIDPIGGAANSRVN